MVKLIVAAFHLRFGLIGAVCRTDAEGCPMLSRACHPERDVQPGSGAQLQVRNSGTCVWRGMRNGRCASAPMHAEVVPSAYPVARPWRTSWDALLVLLARERCRALRVSVHGTHATHTEESDGGVQVNSPLPALLSVPPPSATAGTGAACPRACCCTSWPKCSPAWRCQTHLPCMTCVQRAWYAAPGEPTSTAPASAYA